MTELLAVNLDKAAFDAVAKHGASTGETIALPNLTVTVLKPAAQEDVASLFSRLSGQMQSTDFVFNYVYRPVGSEPAMVARELAPPKDARRNGATATRWSGGSRNWPSALLIFTWV